MDADAASLALAAAVVSGGESVRGLKIERSMPFSATVSDRECERGVCGWSRAEGEGEGEAEVEAEVEADPTSVSSPIISGPPSDTVVPTAAAAGPGAWAGKLIETGAGAGVGVEVEVATGGGYRVRGERKG